MLGFWLWQFNAGSLVWGLCLLLWSEFSVWLFEFNNVVRIRLVRFEVVAASSVVCTNLGSVR